MVIGTAVFTSIFRGRAAAAIGAAISRTPFTYSARQLLGVHTFRQREHALKHAISDLFFKEFGFFLLVRELSLAANGQQISLSMNLYVLRLNAGQSYAANVLLSFVVDVGFKSTIEKQSSMF